MANISVYDPLIEAILLGEKVLLDPTESLASFRSAWYRFAKTDIGKTLASNKKLICVSSAEGTLIQLKQIEHRSINFRVVSDG